ncbi:MAG: hypothetical protein EB038_07575 [Cyclobacteriaceae bacterium]|nr:hypothetical protein [Cyclobacteriaceae bacterium]
MAKASGPCSRRMLARCLNFAPTAPRRVRWLESSTRFSLSIRANRENIPDLGLQETVAAEEGFIFSEEFFEVAGTGGHQVANHLGGFLSTAQAHSEDFELQPSAQGEQAISEDLVRGGSNE